MRVDGGLGWRMWSSRSKKQRFFVTLLTAIFANLFALDRKLWDFGHGSRNLFSYLHGGQFEANDLKPFENEKHLSLLRRNLCHSLIANAIPCHVFAASRLGVQVFGPQPERSSQGAAGPSLHQWATGSAGLAANLLLNSLKHWGHPTITTALGTAPACQNLQGCFARGRATMYCGP